MGQQNWEFFNSDNEAIARRQELSSQGQQARIIIDPLAGRYPALAVFENIAVELCENEKINKPFDQAC